MFFTWGTLFLYWTKLTSLYDQLTRLILFYKQIYLNLAMCGKSEGNFGENCIFINIKF